MAESDKNVQKKYLDTQSRDDLAAKLFQQLGKYPQANREHGILDLSKTSKNVLYKDCNDYLLKVNNPRQHREAFILFAIDLLKDEKNYSATRVEGSLADIFKKREIPTPYKNAVDLYKKALKEEMMDSNYRDAAFNEATYFIEGATFEKPPSVIIAGPSACGKSHATDRVLDALKNLPQAKDANGQPVMQGNVLTSIDGGIFRKVSQMRKLAIRVANELGYSGIKDLHDKSQALECMRSVTKEILMSESKFGIVLPETYSGWISPFSNHKNFMKALSKDRNLIFTMVVGAHDGFQNVVKFMGHSRALKTDDSEVNIDLNDIENLKESKGYAETGFAFGKWGSNNAFDFYVVLAGEEVLTIKIPNDLILLREDPGTGKFLPAKSGDKNAFMISESIYKAWQASDGSLSLFEFNAKNRDAIQPPLEISQLLQNMLAQGKAERLITEPIPLPVQQYHKIDVCSKDMIPEPNEIMQKYKSKVSDHRQSISVQQKQDDETLKDSLTLD